LRVEEAFLKTTHAARAEAAAARREEKKRQEKERILLVSKCTVNCTQLMDKKCREHSDIYGFQ
jgi:hypothetical protein